jgi:hypothetical protein
MPEKKSDTETKELEDSCEEGTKKDLEGGGFTCKKDGKWVTCIPSDGTTYNCWESSAPPPTNVIDALIQVQKALRATEAAIGEVISPEPEY